MQVHELHPCKNKLIYEKHIHHLMVYMYVYANYKPTDTLSARDFVLDLPPDYA